jgi:hypothetical protein
MPFKGKFPCGFIGQLVWGLPAAITDFLSTLPSEVGIHKMTRSLDWMPVDGDCVVSGQISGSAEAGLVPGFSLSSLLFDFVFLILNETLKIARTNLR